MPRGHPWAGGWTSRRGGERKGVPGGRGLIVLIGGVRKARQKRGAWVEQDKAGLSPPGHSVGGGLGHSCPPLALGEPASPWHNKPQLERGRLPAPPALPLSWGLPAPSGSGVQILSLLSNMPQPPPHLTARVARGTAAQTLGLGEWSRCYPLKKIQNETHTPPKISI